MEGEKMIYCVRCKEPHVSEEYSWTYPYRPGDGSVLYEWACSDHKMIYPEFITKQMKEDRVKYASDMVQTHRGGEFSREYAELYPERTKKLIKDGVVKAQEVKKSKYVWGKDLKGWDSKKKVDVSSIVK